MITLYNPKQHGRLLNPEEGQARLKDEHGITFTLQTMADMRADGRGPKFIKPNARSVRYPEKLLDEWAIARHRKPILEQSSEYQPPLTSIDRLRRRWS